MDVAVLADIHGNFEAFQTCIHYALERNIKQKLALLFATCPEHIHERRELFVNDLRGESVDRREERFLKKIVTAKNHVPFPALLGKGTFLMITFEDITKRKKVRTLKNDRTEDKHFRATPEEKELIRKKAEKAGLSMSDYLRRQALSKKVTVISPEIFKEYKELCGRFGWYGNNINQIAKHLNGGGDQYTVIRWLENYQMDLEDLLIRFKMLMEKKIAA